MRASSPSKSKPGYDGSLCAYQRAFQAELQQIVRNLPLAASMRVLDVPCGNGFYSRLLAQRLNGAGRLDCVDLCQPYLALTRRRLQAARCAWQTHRDNACQLPFADQTFDLVWCAQSLISLEEPLAAFREMMRVLRPAGTLAVLENDFFHHVLLPWPADLEMPIQRAIQKNSRARFGSSGKLTPVRRLPQLLRQAGFCACRKHTFVADRQSPWPASTRRFLAYHLEDLRRLVGGRFPARSRTAYRRFVDPRRPDSVFGDRAMDLTCLNVVYEARKPGRH